MSAFNPNAAASKDSGIFGLPFTEAESALVLLPVPWEATTSYGGGTSHGPAAILRASHQVDLYDLDVLRPYEAGIHILDESPEVRAWNEAAKASAHQKNLAQVNAAGERLNGYVLSQTRRLLRGEKLVGVIGGDHSVPLGAFQALGEKYRSYGILHVDAHSDTRKAYGGFTWSHASIMYNALEMVPAISKITQVGIRDICEEEVDYLDSQKHRVQLFSDRDNQRRMMEGNTWNQICLEIVASLPNEVWISFDIDGLDPSLCPHTGTPVPGGLKFAEACHLFSALVRSGRRVVGFDLNEVAPDLQNPSDEWDANVGARLLYKLCAWTLASQSKAKLQIT